MDTRTQPPVTTSRHGSVRWRAVGYWLATAAVAGELLLGGIWDIARLPFVADLVTHLGYPSYFLVLLGTWKVLGGFALLIPGRALLKEWAYAGAFFTYTGAIASHLTTGYALGEVGLLSVLTVLTVLSWALRPPSRRTLRQAPTGPHLPGHGLSSPASYRPGEARSAAVQLIDDLPGALDLPTAPVIGHSAGGMYALWHAAERPGKISCPTLIGAPAATSAGGGGHSPVGGDLRRRGRLGLITVEGGQISVGDRRVPREWGREEGGCQSSGGER